MAVEESNCNNSVCNGTLKFYIKTASGWKDTTDFFYPQIDTKFVIKRLKEAYKKEYNETPDAFAALSYDATMMVIEAMKRANSVDTVKIKDELAKTKDYLAVSGLITLNETHDAVKSAVIIEMKDGLQTFKEKINP